MGFGGLDSSDLSLYRLVKGGEHGLNISLLDLYGLDIEVPSLFDIIKTFFTKKKIRIKISGRTEQLIRKLIKVQHHVDKEIEKEINKAKRG
jgi:hypothetical protein